MSFEISFEPEIGHLKVKEGSTDIPEEQFKDERQITSVSIPETVAAIELVIHLFQDMK